MFKKNTVCCDLAPLENMALSVSEFFGVVKFHSQVGQDRWVIQQIFPNVRDGYFMDVGSGDGVLYSNTKTLEDIGWDGVCVDPFPTNMAKRQCRLFKEVVSDEIGRTVSFRKAGSLGGIDDKLGRWKDTDRIKESEVVEFKTASLTDILERAGAPTFIHFMSIDIEGAELDALKGLDFSRYQVGAFTIEHNFEEPKRSQIKALLESNGYRFARTIAQDDCYLPAEAPHAVTSP